MIERRPFRIAAVEQTIGLGRVIGERQRGGRRMGAAFEAMLEIAHRAERVGLAHDATFLAFEDHFERHDSREGAVDFAHRGIEGRVFAQQIAALDRIADLQPQHEQRRDQREQHEGRGLEDPDRPPVLEERVEQESAAHADEDRE